MGKKNGGIKTLLLFLLVTTLASASPTPQVALSSDSTQRPVPLLPGQSITLLPSGQWLLLGGQGKNASVTAASLQDPRTGVVTPLKTGMLLARAWHSATLLPNGLVLVIGGYGTNGSIAETAEIFDPSSQTSGFTVSGLLPRAHHTATLLTNGSVVIVGGVGSDGDPLALAEQWDSRASSASVLQAELQSERRDHTATLMPDGTVLLWGGTDARGNAIPYADVYYPDSQSFSVDTVASESVPNLNVPILEASLPADGATGVPAQTLIALRFSKPLRVGSLNHSSVTLTGPNGTVLAKIVPTEAGMLCFVTPNAPLHPGATYTLSLRGATDTHNLSLVSKDVTFTVAMPAVQSASGSGSKAQSSSADVTPLVAPPGVTALSGQVLRLDGTPLARVSLSVGIHKALSDRNGRFLLQNIEDGNRTLLIEGSTANRPGASYGLYEAAVSINPKQTNFLPYKIWMTALDTVHEVQIPSPTTSEVVVTTPLIPGLELHIPPHTVIRDYYGKVVTHVGITQVPVDRPPFPLPTGIQIPLYFTIQPGDAILEVNGDGNTIQGARLVYPNGSNAAPGVRTKFWKYGPANNEGWYVYGFGTVTSDRTQIFQNPATPVWSFTPTMLQQPNTAPPAGPNPTSPNPGDPVDASTGLLVYRHTDSYLPDVIPINVGHTYRQADGTSRAFGVGTALSYDIFLVGDTSQYSYVDLVLPDGSRYYYYRTSSGTQYNNAAFTHTSTPTIFYGSTISYECTEVLCLDGLWILRLKNGMVLTFPDVISFGATPLIAIQDRYGNQLKISRPGSSNISQITSPNGRWVQFTYDTCNRVHQITDDIGRSTVYTYDNTNCSLGHLQTVTDPDLGVTSYCWFGSTCPTVTNAPFQAAAKPSLDRGDTARLSASRSADPEEAAVLIPGCATNTELMTITDARGNTYLQNSYTGGCQIQTQTLLNTGTFNFQYVFNSTGFVTQTQVTDPNGNLSVYNFGPSQLFPDGFYTGGYLQSAIFASGSTVQQQFTLGYGTSASNPGNFLQSLTDPLSRVMNFTYDALGNLTSFTKLAGTSGAATTSVTYEPTFSRITSITDPLGHTTTAAYNDSINQTLVTDARGNQWTTTRNGLGQVVSRQDPAGDAWRFAYSGADLTTAQDPLGNATTYVYDGAGRMRSLTDPLGETTTATYDGLNDVLTVTDPLGEVTKYTYNANQFLTSVTDPKNTSNPTQFLYNNMDQVYQRTDALGNSDYYQYDLNGNLNCHTDRKGQITVYAYDALNRPASAGYGAASCTATTFQNSVAYTFDGGNRLTQVADTLAGTITRRYDGLDDLTYENTPQGTVNYQFDSARRRSNMTVTGQTEVVYGYDPANNLTQITQGSGALNIAYDSVGRRSSLILPNGITVGYSYDFDSHVTGITYQNGATTLGNLIYGYDALGRRSQVTGSYARSNLPAALTSATYNFANQIATWAGAAITYDQDGNISNDGTNTYIWDLRNHLSAIAGGNTAAMVYDGLNRRIEKTINGTSTSFLYDNLNIVQELSGTTPTANLITGLGLDEIFSRTVVGSTATSFLRDALGSTVATTGSGAGIQTTYTYDPYGSTTATGTASTNAFQYTGRENDGTGLYYYRARYYEPGFERFASEDPIGFTGGRANLFTYVADNPLNFVDPWGLKPPPGPCTGPNCQPQWNCSQYFTCMPVFPPNPCQTTTLCNPPLPQFSAAPPPPPDPTWCWYASGAYPCDDPPEPGEPPHTENPPPIMPTPGKPQWPNGPWPGEPGWDELELQEIKYEYNLTPMLPHTLSSSMRQDGEFYPLERKGIASGAGPAFRSVENEVCLLIRTKAMSSTNLSRAVPRLASVRQERLRTKAKGDPALLGGPPGRWSKTAASRNGCLHDQVDSNHFCRRFGHRSHCGRSCCKTTGDSI